MNNIVGDKYNRLTIVEYLEKTKTGHHRVKCVCDCGGNKITTLSNLKHGLTKSCGCLQREQTKKSFKCPSNLDIDTKLKRKLSSIKSRCYNTNSSSYKNYGARGIKVCDEWLNDFMNFYNWAIDNGYKDGLTLDRIDVNGNYEPSNCRWITSSEQRYNTRRNRLIQYNNCIKSLTEWAIEYNIHPHTLSNRLKSNWSIDKALTTPVRCKRNNYNKVD